MLGFFAVSAGALTVTMVVPGKTSTATTISHLVNGTVTISVATGDFPTNAPPPAPAGIPTFTWNLYDDDGPFAAREQPGVDWTQADATAPAAWVFRLIKKGVVLSSASWDYTYTALPALSLPATDTAIGSGDPDPFVEVIATLGAKTATNNVCTPDLPSVGQGDLGVRQPLGSVPPMSNAFGISDYPVRAFSRGYDEIWDLLDAGSGVDPGIFLSSASFSGTLPAPEIGSLFLYSAPSTGFACAEEPAGGVGAQHAISFFNLNTGAPGSGVATDEYYFVAVGDTVIDYAPMGDITQTSVFFDLDDLSGRAVTALAVEDSGVRGVFEASDHLVYAYEGSTQVWVMTGPLSEPMILSANGKTFDGTATFDYSHLEDDGSPGAVATPTGSITSLSIASNLSNIQPVPSDRVFPDYDNIPLPAFFDDFETGNLGLFTDVVGSVFDFEDDVNIFGGQREVHIDVASTDGSGVFASTNNGVYTHDQSFDTFARSEVVWDGTDASVAFPGAGSLALDLEADPSNAFVIAIERIENFSGETPLPAIGAFVELDEPGRPRIEVMQSFTGPIVADEFLILPYQLFGPDVTNVAAVGILVDGTTNADFFTKISGVTTTTVDTYPPIVDAFQEPQIAISRSAVGSEFVFDRNPITMTGEVEISANVILSENVASLDVTLGQGSLDWSQGMAVRAVGSIVWDGMDGNASTDLASAVNLTNQDAGGLELTIDSLVFDAGATGGVGISLGVISRSNPSEFFSSPVISLITPTVVGETIFVPFSVLRSAAAAQPTMAELSEIASLSLMVDGTAQSEFSLSFGELRTASTPVPEPGLTASLMAGLIGLVALRRRRRAVRN